MSTLHPVVNSNVGWLAMCDSKPAEIASLMLSTIAAKSTYATTNPRVEFSVEHRWRQQTHTACATASTYQHNFGQVPTVVRRSICDVYNVMLQQL